MKLLESQIIVLLRHFAIESEGAKSAVRGGFCWVAGNRESSREKPYWVTGMITATWRRNKNRWGIKDSKKDSKRTETSREMAWVYLIIIIKNENKTISI